MPAVPDAGSFRGCHLFNGLAGGQVERGAQLRVELVGEVGVVAQELFGILASLAEPDFAVVEPGAALLYQLLLDAEVDELAGPGDPFAVVDVELGLAER